MLRDVRCRTEQSFLFTRPQPDANGALWFQIQGLNDAHRFHRNRDAGAVVGGARAGVPRIHVATQHHDFVLQSRIAAGNLRDGVVAHRIGVLPFDRDVHFHLHFFAGLQHAHDPVVVLVRQNNLRQVFRRVFVVRSFLPRRPRTKWNLGHRLRHGGLLHKDRSAVSRATCIGKHGRAFFLREHQLAHIELRRRALLRRHAKTAATTAAAVWPAAGRGRVGQGQQSLFVLTPAQWLKARFQLARRLSQNNRAFQLAFVLFQIRFGLGVDKNYFAGDRAVRCRRPRFWISNERNVLRVGDLRAETLQRPAAAKRAPRFEVRFLHAPFFQSVARPVARALHVWRGGQARPDHIAEIRKSLHHLRSFHSFFLDADDRIVWIGRGLLRRPSSLAECGVRDNQSEKQKRGGKLASNHLERLLITKIGVEIRARSHPKPKSGRTFSLD